MFKNDFTNKINAGYKLLRDYGADVFLDVSDKHDIKIGREFIRKSSEKNPDKPEIEFNSKIYKIKRRKIRIDNMEHSKYHADFNNREIDIRKFIEELGSDRIDNENDIWIYGEREYPCISLMIKGNEANVHYFKSADDFATCLNEENSTGDTVCFGDIELDGKYVIDRKRAQECIREFANTGERPECVKWFEL